MRVYEEYADAADKRKAQRASIPLKRRQCTGLARGYLLVFDEDGYDPRGSGCFSAVGELYDGQQPGAEPRCVTHCSPHVNFLNTHCRLVGFEYIPKVWQQAFARRIKDWIDNYQGQERKKYARMVRIAETMSADRQASLTQQVMHP